MLCEGAGMTLMPTVPAPIGVPYFVDHVLTEVVAGWGGGDPEVKGF